MLIIAESDRPARSFATDYFPDRWNDVVSDFRRKQGKSGSTGSTVCVRRTILKKLQKCI